MNNDEFVEGLRNHEPAAVTHLHECYVPAVWRFVYFRVDGDQHLAEDIVSESVLALVMAVGKGVEIEFPSAWLRSVATRRVQDHFRAAARVAHLMEQAESQTIEETTETPSSKHDEKLLQEEIREVLEHLREEHRLVLEWKYVDRVSVREIATRLGLSEKAAESVLFRARNTFREQMRLREIEMVGEGLVGGRQGDSGSKSTTIAESRANRHSTIKEVAINPLQGKVMRGQS